ncbi:unnamed protein product [Musa hybrid cultivar]
MRILMVGLNAASKITIFLFKLKLGERSLLPSPLSDSMWRPWSTKTLVSPFGMLVAKIRPLWSYHFQNIQGLIFAVDSNDRDCIIEARDELHRMLNEDELPDVVLLVFANKQDSPSTMNTAKITDKLGFHSLSQRCRGDLLDQPVSHLHLREKIVKRLRSIRVGTKNQPHE